METRQARFAMPRRTLLEVPVGRPWQVTCGSGSLWVTLDHDLRDIVLERGQAFAVRADQRALVFALDDAVLELQEEQAAPVRERRLAQPLPMLAGAQ